jgi:NitT/TauT family transport system permease protein
MARSDTGNAVAKHDAATAQAAQAAVQAGEPARETPGPAATRPAARRAGAARHRGRHHWATVLALQVLVLLIGAGIWQWLAVRGSLPDIYTSRPTRIVAALWDGLRDGPLLPALGITLEETVVGFVIASAAGILGGIAIYLSPLLERVSRPFLTAANNMPRLALTPLFVIWLGVGTWSHITLVITMVFFVVLMNTYAGFSAADRDHLVLAKVLGASRRKLFTTFLLPAAVPAIFVGLQLGLTYSFMGAVIGEIITGGQGLGALISTYSSTFDSAGIFADLLLMAIVATLLSGLIKAAESRLLAWRRHELRGLGS